MKKVVMALGVTLSLSAFGAHAQSAAAPAGRAARTRPPGLALTSSSIEDGGIIPDKYTQAATGTAVSPALSWSNIPDGTVSFVLICHDPDTSVNKTTEEILHWMAFNIPASTHALPEGVPAGQVTLSDGATQGENARKKVGYMGMGAGPNGPYHHYTFDLYALDTKLSVPADASRKDVEAAMEGHILGKGVLVGRFRRPQ